KKDHLLFIYLQAEVCIRDRNVTGVQTCALPIWATSCITRTKKGPTRYKRDWSFFFVQTSSLANVTYFVQNHFSAYFNVTQFVKINRVTFSRTIHFFLLYFLSLHRCVWCTFQLFPFLPQNIWCVLQAFLRLQPCLIQIRSAFYHSRLFL